LGNDGLDSRGRGIGWTGMGGDVRKSRRRMGIGGGRGRRGRGG